MSNPYPSPPQPPPPVAVATQRVPAWAWVFVVAAVVAVIGGVLPWFRPSIGSAQADSAVYSWNDGRIGLAGPILLLGSGIRWFGALIGRWSPAVSRRGSRPANALRSGAVFAAIAGAITVVLAIVAWALVPHNYKDWDEAAEFAREHGLSLSRGPQAGFWLVAVCGVVFLALGILGMVQFRSAAPAAPSAMPQPAAYPSPGQPYAGQPYAGQPYAGQPYAGPPNQPYPGQPYSAPSAGAQQAPPVWPADPNQSYDPNRPAQ